jgi:uncharacterized protein YbjT (DUF2867 family)
MSDDRQPILVFGATGQQGGATVKALLNAAWPVRALVRDASGAKATALREAGAELAQGRFDDIAGMRTAMHGIYGVFSVLPGTLPEEEEIRLGCAIADLAADSGVAHFIYSSGASVGDKPTGVPRFDAKGHVEAHIRSLPLTATIVRPMIFMEMLPRAAFGLDEGKFNFFLRPDQSMQLVAVEDIGKFVAAIFANRARFAGQTLRIASDVVTGSDLATIFSQAAGHPIAYARFTPEALAANPSFAAMSASLENGPLSHHAKLDLMRELNPEVQTFRSWLNGPGRAALDQALSSG